MLWPAMIFIGEGKCTHTHSSFNEIYVEDIDGWRGGLDEMMQMSIHIELNYSRVFDIRSQLLGVQIRSFSSTKSLSGDPVKADSHRFNTQTCDTHFFVPQSGTN